MSNAMNSQSFNVENDINKIADFYNRDMALCASDIDLNDEAFIALLGMNGTVDYYTSGFGTLRKIVWKYDGNETVFRCEVIMPANTKI